MLSSPDVDEPDDAAGTAGPEDPVVEPDDVESPITLTELPPMVTGAFTTGDTRVPPAMLSSPDVDEPDVPAGTLEPPVVEPDDVESPITLTALPPMVTGAFTTGDTRVPLAMPPSPEVDDDGLTGTDAAAEAGVAAESELESPMMLTALPPTFTGRETSGDTCVPPAMLSSPDVVAGAASGAFASDPADVDDCVDEEFPITEIAFPPTVTGTETMPVTRVPLAMPPSPEVDDGGLTGTDAAAEAGVAAESDFESPRTLTALPPTLTGRETTASTRVPESTPSSPEVSAAFAAVAPRRVNPPAKRTP